MLWTKKEKCDNIIYKILAICKTSDKVKKVMRKMAWELWVCYFACG